MHPSYRYSLLVLALALAAPAYAQDGSPLYGITSCCPNEVVTFDVDTGETTTVAEIGTSEDVFNALVGSGVYDTANDRVLLVRNGTYIAADVSTGAVTEFFDAGPFTQFAGFDDARGLLYAFTVETEVNESDTTVVYTNRLLAVDPDTEAVTEVAVVGGGVDNGEEYEGDTFGSVTGPAVLATGPARLFTVRNGRFLAVSLPDGALDEQSDAGTADLLAYAAARGTLLTYTRDFPTDGVGEAQFFVSEYDPATGEQTVRAQVGSGTFVEGEGYDGDVFTASTGIALFDASGDRVLLNRNGTLIAIDVTSGAISENVPLGNVRLIGSPVNATTDAEGQPDAAAFEAVAYPNPFRDTARLDLTLVQAEAVRVEAFDLLGRRVAVLHDGLLPAGRTRLDGLGDALPAGVYVVRIASPSAQQTLRLVRLD